MRRSRNAATYTPIFALALMCGITLFALGCIAQTVSDSFRGAARGMNRQGAFQSLCNANADIIPWGVVLPNRGKYTFTRPMRCTDWNYFKISNFWGLKTTSADCPAGSLQYAVINLRKERVFRIYVWCQTKS